MNRYLVAAIASLIFAACVQAAPAAHTARTGFVADNTPPHVELAGAPSSPQALIFDEGFNDISLLAGSGWVMTNHSAPVGSTNWFQGTTVAAGGPFDAFDGAANAYIGANYNNTGSTGTISNWLIAPNVNFGAGATLTFYTRKASPDTYADNLEVRYSTNGASIDVGSGATAVGDFTNLLLAINPTQVLGVYPTTWTQYTITNLPHSGNGRIAFRYFVNSAGLSGTASDYIGIDRVSYSTGDPEYKVGGSVSGLAGSGLVLRLNGANDLPVNADGSFEFSPYITQGGSYAVTVAQQPTSLSQTCSVINGEGNIGATVTDVQVSCVTDSFSIAGTVSGLAGSGLSLQLNGGQNLAISADGAFVFPTSLVDGSTYAVTIATQPSVPNQSCVVSNDAGILAGANVADVQVTCTTLTYFIGGNASGVLGSGLALHLDSGQDVSVAANGAFMFPTPLTDGSTYLVTVGTPPTNPNQACTVTSGSGTLAGSDVTSVQVSCATVAHSVGGNVVGLDGSGLVLQLNAANDLPVPADGSFTFSQQVQEGAAYAVTVATQPNGGASNLCIVENGSGTMNTMSISNIVVTCDVIFISGFESP